MPHLKSVQAAHIVLCTFTNGNWTQNHKSSYFVTDFSSVMNFS